MFFRYRIRPNVLRNVAIRNLSTTILGKTVSMPISISPTAMQKMAHPEGECATARAAQEMGIIFILGLLSTSSIEEVSLAAPLATKWFQLFILKDREMTISLIRRAEIAGYQALVLTVDCAILATRRADVHNNFTLPEHLRNLDCSKESHRDNHKHGSGISYIHNSLNINMEWNDIKWIKSITNLPIILKGILTAEDAVKAVSMNVEGIIVSNHGGRQLDTSVSPIDALPDIVKAAGNKAEIYLDGGIREGIDVFKALALGAKSVFLGRPVIWSLAYSGEEGVKNMLNILSNEFDVALALTGCTSVEDISPNLIVKDKYFSHL